MDGDGEDDPKYILKLVSYCQQENNQKIFFTSRSKRSEGVIFRLSYFLYRKAFKILSGQEIRFGNFSIIPYELMHQLVAVSEIWNHYAAGIIKSKLPYAQVPTERSYRITGKSKMNFVSLVSHGISALSVYSDIIGTRLLILSLLMIVLAFLLILVVITIKIFTNLAIPGWSTFAVGLLSLFILQFSTLSFFFIFLILGARNSYSFLPSRDYRYFILSVHQVFPEL